MDEILQRVGLKYDDLSSSERETLNSWLSAIDNQQLTLDGVRIFIHSLRENIENELVNVGHNSKEDIFMKARLRNIMLIESFLTSPQKARQSLDRALAGIVSNRKT